MSLRKEGEDGDGIKGGRREEDDDREGRDGIEEVAVDIKEEAEGESEREGRRTFLFEVKW